MSSGYPITHKRKWGFDIQGRRVCRPTARWWARPFGARSARKPQGVEWVTEKEMYRRLGRRDVMRDMRQET